MAELGPGGLNIYLFLAIIVRLAELITWESSKGHTYGHCNKYNNCPYVCIRNLLDQLCRHLDSLKLPTEALEWVEGLKESHVDIAQFSESAIGIQTSNLR